jgi:hypothetical protein
MNIFVNAVSTWRDESGGHPLAMHTIFFIKAVYGSVKIIKFKSQIIQANIRSSPFGVVLMCASSTVLLLNLCFFPAAVYSLSRMTIVLFELLDDSVIIHDGLIHPLHLSLLCNSRTCLYLQ